LSFRIDLSGNNTETNTPGFGGTSAVFYDVYNYPSLAPYQYNILNPNGTYGYTNPANAAASGNNIVGGLAYGGYSRALENLMAINFSAIQRLDYITKGLMFKITLSGSNSNTTTSTLTRKNFPSYFYNQDLNTYTSSNVNIYRVDPWSSGYATNGAAPNNPKRQSDLRASLNYANSFGKNNVTVLAQASQSTQVLVNNATPTSNYIPSNLSGLVGRVTYDYAHKYQIEFNGSYNGTDKFAAAHRYGFFPAASAGWNIGEEKFVKNNLKFLDLFKLRASYGIVGSDNLPNGALNSYEENYIRGIATGTVPGTYSFGETNTPYVVITPSTLANNNVTWERQRELNLGADFSILGGKITGTVDVFRYERSDILTALKTVPNYYGVISTGLPPENIGIIDNNYSYLYKLY